MVTKVFTCIKVKSLSRVQLCDPTDCSLPGSSFHGIFQARILEWVAIPFSRGSSRPRDQTQGSCIAGRFFTFRATREALCFLILRYKESNSEIAAQGRKEEIEAEPIDTVPASGQPAKAEVD